MLRSLSVLALRALALLLPFASASYAQVSVLRTATPDELAEFGVTAATVQDVVAQQPDLTEELTFEVLLGDRRSTIRAARVELRAPDFRILLSDGVADVEAPMPSVLTFQGIVAGDPESLVAVTLTGTDIDAAIRLTDGTYWGVAPAARNSGGSAHVVFRSEDALPHDHICGATEPSVPILSANSGSPRLRQAEIALEVDREFYLRQGSSSSAVTAYVMQVLNWTDAVFRRDVEITYRVTTILIQTTALYASRDPQVLLVEFRDYWVNHRGSIRRDIAHLFTGHDLTGGVIGIAYVGAVCDLQRSFGISQMFPNPLARCALTAHELGHNWNASHCSGNDCRIMCPGLGGCTGDMTAFGAQSRSAMWSYADAQTCLSGVGGYFTMENWTPSGIGTIDDFWIGDFDGDGRDDMFRYVSGSGLEVSPSRGDRFGSRSVWSGSGVGDLSNFWIGDFDGDGRDDVFRYVSGSGIEVMLSRGDRFGSRTVWTGSGVGNLGDFWVGDYDGDGRDDVMRYRNGVGLEVMLSRGDRFGSPTVWSGAGVGTIGKFWVGDFDGDGRDDVMRYRSGVGLEVMPSRGDRFGSATEWSGSGVGNLSDFWVGDFDGDGRADVFRYLSGSGIQVMLSLGHRFDGRSTWSGAGVGDFTWWIGDFNGDDRSDIMRYRTGVGIDVGLSSSPDHITVGVMRHGRSCPLPSGVVPRMSVSGVPKSRTVLRVLATGAGSRSAMLMIGASDSLWGGIRLPLDLGGLGARGCQLYIDPIVVLGPFAIDVGYQLTMPSDVGLVAQCFFTQALIGPDLSLNTLGWLSTDYLEVEILP
jgi:hypothetical protein